MGNYFSEKQEVTYPTPAPPLHGREVAGAQGHSFLAHPVQIEHIHSYNMVGMPTAEWPAALPMTPLRQILHGYCRFVAKGRVCRNE